MVLTIGKAGTGDCDICAVEEDSVVRPNECSILYAVIAGCFPTVL